MRRRQSLKLIRPDWPAPPQVKAFSTLRYGGVSSGGFDSLNLGDHVGDLASNVAENRRRLLDECGGVMRVNWLTQTHSIEVVECGVCADNNADASFSRTANQACVVMTADCLPLLLADVQGTQVAAVHAGWRGLADGIIEEAVKVFDAPKQMLMAWTGPCISAQAFEIGLDVKRQLGGPEASYRRHADPKKVYADLPALAEHRLRGVGVSRVFHSGLCTYGAPRDFFSYRRDGKTGRMATLIWLSDE